jgi:hypothetical protein
MVTEELSTKPYNTKVENVTTDSSEKLKRHVLITLSFIPVPNSMQLIL